MTEIHLTYTTRLVFNSQDDLDKMMAILVAHRDAVNAASKVRFEKGTRNSLVELHDLFYYPYRSANPDVPAQVVIRAENECLAEYRSVKSNKHRLKSPAKKKRLSMRLDKRLYAYEDRRFRLTTFDKRVVCKPHLYDKLEHMLTNYIFCDPELFVRDGQIWIAMTFKVPTLAPKKDTAVGVDLGVRMSAVTSEGKFYQDRKFNKEKRRLRYLKRTMQSKTQKGSKKAKRNLKRLRRKERNKNRNQTHHLANAILKDTKADVVVLENLSKIKRKKHTYQNKNAISQVPFCQLLQVLSYKAPLKRKTVITIKPRYTSQVDHRTNKRDGQRRGRRYYGKDGVILDADHNASVNIAVKSKHPVSYRLVLDGQAVVNQPIVQKL